VYLKFDPGSTTNLFLRVTGERKADADSKLAFNPEEFKEVPVYMMPEDKILDKFYPWLSRLILSTR